MRNEVINHWKYNWKQSSWDMPARNNKAESSNYFKQNAVGPKLEKYQFYLV